MDCVFCNLMAKPSKLVAEWPETVAFVPLNPVTEGHVLVVPRRHVTDALENPRVTAATMRRAAEFAKPPCNLITSVGKSASQSVSHLHIHVVPRSESDGLRLPWSGQ